MFKIRGPKKLKGEIKVSGAKNVAMKLPLLGLLTDKPVTIKNIPLISSVFGTAEFVRRLGVKVKVNKNHTLDIHGDNIKSYRVPLELGGLYRTATMVMGPLLCRFGKAIVPNPGGCRLGKRSIDRHIAGLVKMGATIKYKDGFFFAKADKLRGVRYKFARNTHTGTETLILASVLSKGETILDNAAEEPEIDDLISILTLMGAKVKRTKKRQIVIKGVDRLKGADYEIMPDRNEAVTFAVSALASGGDIVVDGVKKSQLNAFFEKLKKIGASWRVLGEDKVRFFSQGKKFKPTNIVTKPHPGFMTDWQAPFALLLTQAGGISSIHETIFEDRFGYVLELQKMGADISYFRPKVNNPEKIYNFNISDRNKNKYQGIKIKGKTPLHNAVLEVSDLRAGATLVIAAIIASGESTISGVDHIDRGYEHIEERLSNLGADIARVNSS